MASSRFGLKFREGRISRFIEWCGRARLVWLVVAGLMLLALVFVVKCGPYTTVHLEAVTEVVRLETVPSAAGALDGSRPIDWHLGSATAKGCIGDQEHPQELKLDRTDSLTILPGALITLERLEDSSMLELRLEASPAYRAASRPSKCGADLPVRINIGTNGSVKEVHGKRLLIAVKFEVDSKSDYLPEAIVLPIDAKVQAGQEVGEGTASMLESGSLSIHASHDQSPIAALLQFLGRRKTYIAEKLDLQRGDSVSIPEEGIARGYLRVPAKGTIQLAAFGAAERVTVLRAGNARVEVAQSFWSRVANEPAIGSVLALLALWFGMLEVALKLREISPREH